MASLRVVEATSLLVDVAGDLAEALALRGYDAIHLAAALSLDDPDVALLSWDEDLRQAAESVGLALIHIPSPPR